MIKPIRKPSLLRKEKAQTLVEFALVFPFILLITYGIIEFGRMMYIYAAVTGAAREGARYGAAVGDLYNRHYTNYMDCDGIRTIINKATILATISDSNIFVWYDNGPGTNPFPNANNICPEGELQYSNDLLKLGDRIGIRVVYN